MAFSLEAAGAGASEGLDTMLQRLLLEQTMGQRGEAQKEDVRHNQATEALSGRQLDIAAGDKASADAARQATIAASGRAAEDEARRKQMEDDALSNPNTPEIVKQFINLRRITPKGETVPPEVLGLKKPSERAPHPVTIDLPGEGTSLPATQNLDTGQVFYRGQDVTARKPTIHHEPQISIGQTDDGFVRIPKAGGAASPVLDQNRAPVMPKSPAQVAARQDLAERVSSHFDDVQSMLDAAEKRGLLGPLKGRTFNEFMAGKVGSTGNAEDDELLGELRQNLSLVRSGLAQLHGRGGANIGIVQSLEKNMDAGFMDHAQLKGALRGMKSWVDTYAKKKGKPAAPGAVDDTDPLGMFTK